MGAIIIWLFLSTYPITDWSAQAQQSYLNANYEEAISHYQVGIESGFVSSELYFNMGNSYFELGDYGHAILYYLRASQFSPRDEAIQGNIERVRALRRDYQQQAHHWGDYVTDSSASFLRLDEMLWIGAVVWAYGCFLIGYWLLKPQFRKNRLFMSINLIIIGLFIAMVCLRSYSTVNRPKAVITASSAPVFSGASQEYLTLYNLYSGAEVRIVERDGGWARLVLPDGSSGWVNRFDFEYIDSQ